MTPSVRRLRTSLRAFTGSLQQSERASLARTLPLREVQILNRDWRMWGRELKQLPPDETNWRSWLILGGRGAGKTRAGAEWVKAQALGDWTAIGMGGYIGGRSLEKVAGAVAAVAERKSPPRKRR